MSFEISGAPYPQTQCYIAQPKPLNCTAVSTPLVTSSSRVTLVSIVRGQGSKTGGLVVSFRQA